MVAVADDFTATAVKHSALRWLVTERDTANGWKEKRQRVRGSQRDTEGS